MAHMVPSTPGKQLSFHLICLLSGPVEFSDTPNRNTMVKPKKLTNLLDLKEVSREQVALQLKNSPNSFISIGTRVILASGITSICDPTDYIKGYKDSSGSKWLDDHLFTLINRAYLGLRRTGKDQSIILNGYDDKAKQLIMESSLDYLCLLGSPLQQTKRNEKIHAKLKAAYTIFKAFTTKSSSESGCCLEFHLNEKGRVVGGQLYELLVPKIQFEQRSISIFHALLSGVDHSLKKEFNLNQPFFCSDSKPSDKYLFHDVNESLQSLGMSDKTIHHIFQLLSAILHLGNIQFEQHPTENDVAFIKNPSDLEIVANLLSIPPKSLETALLVKQTKIGHEFCTILLDAKSAEDHKFYLMQILYHTLSSWLIDYINKKCKSTKGVNHILLVDPVSPHTTKKGDLYTLLSNEFNELIHSGFISAIFKDQLELFHNEGLPLDRIETKNNDNQIQLLLNEDHGINMLLDAAYSSDSTVPALLATIQAEHVDNPAFVESTTNAITISHYFSSATYDIRSLLNDNNIQISQDIISMVNGSAEFGPSQNPLLCKLFNAKTLESIYSNHQMLHPTATLVNNHQSASLSIMAKLKQAQPWFIVAMDLAMTSNKVDSKWLKQQVKYYNLVDVVDQLQSSNDYTHTISYRNFIDRYRDVLRSFNIDESATPKQQTSMLIGMLVDDWSNNKLDTDSANADTSTYTYYGKNCLLLNGQAWQSLEFLSRKLGHYKGTLNESELFAVRVDNMSTYSDTSSAIDDSVYDSEGGSSLGNDDMTLMSDQSTAVSGVFRNEHGDIIGQGDYEIEEQSESSMRRKWVCCTWCLTWWIPTPCIKMCGMKRPDVIMAWREKVALVLIILIMCAMMLFFIAGLGPLICPKQEILSSFELSFMNTKDTPYVAAYGRVVSLNDLIGLSPDQHNLQQLSEQYGGYDITNGFPRTPATYCSLVSDKSLSLSALAKDISKVNGTAIFSSHQTLYQAPSTNGDPRSVGEQRMDAFFLNKKYLKYMQGWDPVIVKSLLTDQFYPRQMLIINENVYDMSIYLSRIGDAKYRFLGDQLTDFISNNAGMDVSNNPNFMNQWNNNQVLRDCFNNLFIIGVVDHRMSFRCQFSNYLLLAASILLVSIIGFKFLAALQLGSRREPEEHDKFVILQMPCYTEGEENLKRTIEALASLQYDDKRKLLFITCDGMIVGSGNDRPTPRIVLDILGVDPNLDPDPLQFQSIGEGSKQLNMGKVYTGLYEVMGHLVPFIVIVKIGTHQERIKPGNRGKRDSQMILMRFLNKVYYDTPMSPLELEMYHQIKNVIGVSPSFYEYVLMVDADTIPSQEALNRMISAMIHDTKIAGLCGETKLSNEKESWATMIQVYEYYISHHMAKAFESLFGSVTCLPGCFCMYRLRSPLKNSPLLIANQIIKDYGDIHVDTLHKKNLLSLGEDRYLTTIMLKHFPYHKMVFTQDAQCTTYAPDRWSVLLSQRRRWINSTVHNLAELVNLPQLCGFCCFSMRFVVFIDLFATLVQPAAVCYLVYLLYVVINAKVNNLVSPVPLISLILLAAIYGLQALIFIIKREWQHLGWMVVYILAIPIFSFFLPLYSFWHFDDFSWGNTRIVVGEGGKKQIYTQDMEKFNLDDIPHQRFSEYEQELWEMQKEGTGSDVSFEKQPFDKRQSMGHQSSLMASGYEPYGGMPQTPSYQPSYETTSMQGPSDSELYMETERIINSADLMTMTKKQVRDELSRRFGMDLSMRKDYINKSIDVILGVQ